MDRLNQNNDLQWFVKMLQNQPLIEKLKKITLIIADVDGSLTDGLTSMNAEGEEFRTFSVQDGLGIKAAIKRGIEMFFVTGSRSKILLARMKMLDVPEDHCFLNALHNKEEMVREIQQKVGSSEEQTLFWGDDIPDWNARPAVGIFAVPDNTVFYIKEHADIVVTKHTREGSLRLLLDLILFVQNKHMLQEFIQKTVLQGV